MDYYRFPKLLYGYTLIFAFMYAICSVTITLVLIIHNMIYKEDLYKSNFIRTSRGKQFGIKNKEKFKKIWERCDDGRLKRLLQDSDKIQQLYQKWVAEADSCISDKTLKCSIEMTTN